MTDQTDPPNNLTSIKGGGKPDVTADALRSMRENMDKLIEFHEIDAKVKRAKFNALLREGFSESQALELCKS